MQSLWTYRISEFDDQAILWHFFQLSPEAWGTLSLQFVITFLILTIFIWFNRLLRWPVLFLCLAIWMPLDIVSNFGPMERGEIVIYVL